MSHLDVSSAVSPLLGLASFRPWFFLRFALCWLHYELEGNFKHHLSVLLQTLSANDVKGMCGVSIKRVLTAVISELNALIRSLLQQHPSFTSFTKDFFCHGTGKNGKEKVRVVPIAGRLIYSVQEVIIAALLQCVCKRLMKFLRIC